jgi:lysophospholipase L1-like esterase
MEGTMTKLRAVGRLVRDAWLMLGITLLMFCVLEGGSSLASSIRRWYSGAGRPTLDHRFSADTYFGDSWVRDYYAEFQRAVAIRWSSYVYWRRVPFRGKYINVDNSGLRVTAPVASRTDDQRAPIKVFMFGGSTMWGTGVRDPFTIPSILARDLQAVGVRAEVTNFGETGYVSTQEVIALLLQLRRGQRPDLVVFYDGVNDTFSAYQQRVAGLPQNEFNRITEFNLSGGVGYERRRAMVIHDVVQRLSSVRLLKSVLRRAGVLAEPAVAPRHLPPDVLASDTTFSGQAVADLYLGNVEVVRALGDHFGFKCLFYWQPTMFQKKYLTKYEAKERHKDEAMAPFFAETYAAVRRNPLVQRDRVVHDLSSLFAETREPIYVDWAHPGERGNTVIARRIAEDVDVIIAGAR